ncbi:hypothetical protein BsWGS_15843 [Bradybaena similaris]
MDPPEEITYFVDRREVLLGSSPVSQINADKLPIGELATSEMDANTSAREAQTSCSSEQHVKISRKFERSEVSVEIQGLRETTLSTSETVINDRVRTVYGRSLSGSTSSTELEHTESFVDSHEETEHPVFGENAYLDGEQRERRTSDSFYISQTYQINTENRSPTSMTAVKCVSFKSSKEFELGNHENSNEDTTLHFVDRVEEIIAGESPEAVGSPKEKHVRFLWYDNEQEDIETQKRLQSAREDVQHLIESTNMVNYITDVINDNYMGPESKQVTPTASDNPEAVQQLTEDGSGLIEPGRQTCDKSMNMASGENKDFNLLPKSASLSTEGSYTQSGSSSDAVSMTSSKSYSSSEVTFAFNTSLSTAGDSHQVTAASVVKPTNFPTEFELGNSLTTGRRSPLTLAYSPGMAIRSYALEELEEKRYRATPERTEAEAKSLRFDEESSGVDVDKGSSVDDLSSLTGQSAQELSLISNEAYVADSLSSQRFAVQTGKTSVQEMSREEEDESLDKLVDLESIQVGYRFHDVGIMQEYGGICNLAFDDSDEHETGSSSEDRTSSLWSQDAVNIAVVASGTALSGSSEVLSRSQLITDKDTASSSTAGWHSSVEYSTSFLQEAAGSSVISQNTSSRFSSIQQSAASVTSSFTSEDITHTSEFNQTEIRTSSTSYSSQLGQTRTIFQAKGTEQPDKERLNVAVSAVDKVGQKHVESADESVDVSAVGKVGQKQVESADVSAVGKVGQKQVESADDTDFVKELESVIEAGEKAIQELAESLEKAGSQDPKSQDNWKELKEAEDRSSRKEAEIGQSLQAGKYQAGYTRDDGRINVSLHPASESVPQGKTVDQSGAGVEAVTDDDVGGASTVRAVGHDVENVDETSLFSETKASENPIKAAVCSEAESTVRVTRGDGIERTVVTNGRSVAMESGSTFYRQEVHTTEVVTGRQIHEANGMGRASDLTEVDKSVLLEMSESEAGLHKAESGIRFNEAESRIGFSKSESEARFNKAESRTGFSTAESGAGLHKAESGAMFDETESRIGFSTAETEARLNKAESRTGFSASESDAGLHKAESGARFNEAESRIGFSKSESEARFNKAESRTGFSTAESGASLHKADNVTSITEAEDAHRVMQVDNIEINRKYDTAVSTKRDDNVAISRDDQVARRVVETEDVNKVLDLVAATVASDSSLYISGVSSKTQHAVEINPANGASVHAGLTKNEDHWNQSNALHEPDHKAHLDRVEAESVERVVQATLASDQANAQRNMKAEVTVAGQHLRRETASIKETLKKKKASGSKKSSRIEETSRNKEIPTQKLVALQAKTPKQSASVTRKFNVNAKFEASLRTLGAILKSESISIAVYYDTPEFTLTLSDCWLRSVNSKWQLHSSFTKLLNDLTKDEYSESEDRGVIMSSLAALLKCPLPASPDSSIAMFVQKSGLREFVRYTTVHKTYSWKGMTIQLELPEYGFWVGSVTVPTSCKAELHEAIRFIDSFWKTTGVEALNLFVA